MSRHPAVTIGLYLAPEDPYAPYYREVLDHAGVRHRVMESDFEAHLHEIDLLLLCGYGSLKESQKSALRDWTKTAGRIVLSGSTWGCEEWLGIRLGDRHPSSATLLPLDPEDQSWPEGATSPRFYGGFHGQAEDCTILSRTSLGGVGACLARAEHVGVFAPHVGQTMALMQLGRSVECDGIGPTDGSARLDDGILRAEDGIVLDFGADRRPGVEGTPPLFGEPHADIVQEAWLRLVMRLVVGTGKPALVLWPWPNHATGAGAISVEVGPSDEESSSRLVTLLARVGAAATWLVELPGLPPDFYRTLRNRDHDIGLLFEADQTGWTNEHVRSQFTTLRRGAGEAKMVAARPIDGRWRGRLSFYRALESAGARLSLSKGGRQPGTRGFAFGTSKPFFVHQSDGSHLVAELPYQLHDPAALNNLPAVADLVARTAARYGVFHMSIPAASATNGPNTGLQQALIEMRRAGLPFLSPGAIYRREQIRRALRTRWLPGEKLGLQVISETDLEALGILVFNVPHEAIIDGRQLMGRKLTRWGLPVAAFTLDLEAKTARELRLWIDGGIEAAA